MKSILTFIIAILALSFITKCYDNSFSDENMEKKALKITEVLDSNSIKIFHQWNYFTRGEIGYWSKISGDSTVFHCTYQKIKDTASISIYQSHQFITEFPSTFIFDTSKFVRFNFDMRNDKIFRLRFVGKQGEDHITDTMIPVHSIFTSKNPFDKLASLSAVTDSLEIYGISYQKHIGEFIEFWLSSNYKLTYLPDDLNLSSKSKKFWLDDFSKGKTIKKNWNLHKYENQLNPE